MKVRIVKCSSLGFWYSGMDSDNSVYEIEPQLFKDKDGEWKFKIKDDIKLISAADAIIINEKSDDRIKDISKKLSDLAVEVIELSMKLANLARILILASLLLASCASTTHQPRRVANNTTYPKF